MKQKAELLVMGGQEPKKNTETLLAHTTPIQGGFEM